MKLEDLIEQQGIELKCPACGSKNIDIRSTFFAKWYVCLDCGYDPDPSKEQDEENE